jgi:putative transposase
LRGIRIKESSDEGLGIYHVRSKTVNGEWLFEDLEREVFGKILRQVADFTGTEVITWTMLSNHLHLVPLIPRRVAIDDEELLRRYAVLYPRPTRYRRESIEVLRAQLAENGPVGQARRKQLLALMYDLSQFMKLLKQRFTIWFNKTHNRFGPLWSDRFASELLEAGEAVRNVVAYVDLNCVRAGIVKDPAHYRFCGYAEAVAGVAVARKGLMSLELAPGGDWAATQAAYRMLLFSVGSGAREHGAVISTEAHQEVINNGGQLPLTARWSCRVRHFSAGAVLGSRIFVEEQLTRYRKRHGPCPRTRPRPSPVPNIFSMKSPRSAARA